MDELPDQSRWPDTRISRHQAKLIAERHMDGTSPRAGLFDERCGSRISQVDPIEEVRVNAYGVDTRDCWVAYVRCPGPPLVIRSSEVILVSRQTGEVIYVGSAQHEG